MVISTHTCWNLIVTYCTRYLCCGAYPQTRSSVKNLNQRVTNIACEQLHATNSGPHPHETFPIIPEEFIPGCIFHAQDFLSQGREGVEIYPDVFFHSRPPTPIPLKPIPPEALLLIQLS